MNKKNILCIVQARKNSIRFPSKVLKKIKNKSILEIIFLRLKKSKKINQIVLATSNKKDNKELEIIAKKLNIKVFYGSENNVLDRFYKCSKKYKANIIVRITGDCPLVESNLIDDMLKEFVKNHDLDFMSNTIKRTFPDGLDVEIFTYQALLKLKKKAKSSFDKEHVTSYFYKNSSFKTKNFERKNDLSKERWTLDNYDDFVFFEKIFSNFKNIYFNHIDVVKLIKSKKKIRMINSKFELNEGSSMNLGQKYWKRALNIIPNGNMFFSKRPDLLLPKKWPVYFSKSKGYKVWDLKGNSYCDFSFMGVGTNVIGYSNNEVNNSVIKKLKLGISSTLNSTEEIILSEKLINLHDWAHSVKLCRTGAEAAAIAIRISRAHNKKNKVIICGYHGWQDWYLATNLKNKNNLNQHLIKGVGAEGVLKNLKNSVYQFEYNNINSLKKIIKKHNDISAIIMEVERNIKPKKNFLNKVRKLSKENNINLIFDECTSGFRSNLGGLHLKYGVIPDMCLFGKALGNGYPINAVIGKKNIMKAAEKTFISSTFWSERLGPTAALKTIEIMERDKTYSKINLLDKKVRTLWKKLSKLHKINIKIEGMTGIPSFKFNHKDNLAFKTYITQEMLKKKIFASNIVYLCSVHDSYILKKYKKNLSKIFKKIKECIDNKNEIGQLLEGPVSNYGLREK